MSWRKVMTEEQILGIAKRKGMFFASLRWRDDQIRSLCFRMRKRKLLTGGYRIEHGGFYFYPAKEKPNGNVRHVQDASHDAAGRQVLGRGLPVEGR